MINSTRQSKLLQKKELNERKMNEARACSEPYIFRMFFEQF